MSHNIPFENENEAIQATFDSEEYAQGYEDAHPFNQDCELCFGQGYYCWNEFTMNMEKCPDCQPTGKEPDVT